MKETKARILAVERILSERPKTATEIIHCLENRYNITANRKSIYDDIAVLTSFMNIQYINKAGYYVVKGGAEEWQGILMRMH